MNMNPLLSRFMDLVAYDKVVHTVENEIDVILENIFEIEEYLKKQNLSFEKEKVILSDLKKTVHSHELQMKLYDEKVSNAKNKLNTASNSREYELLKKEFDQASQELYAFEDVLLNAWHIFENAQKNFIQKEATLQNQLQENKEKLIELEKKKEALEILLDAKRIERIEKEKNLPEQWLADYTRMKKTFDNPVVPFENGSCSACFESLAGNEIVQLAKKQLAPCRGCFRFLFIKS